MIYDVIVLGGGPAGYTAAMYAARAGMKTLLLEKLSVGGQMVTTDQIDNYPGLPEGVDGFSLGQAMKQGADLAGASTVFTEILGVELRDEVKMITTDSGIYHAKSVIIATGADHKHLGLAEETELVGRGVHYCATCDGMFYRGKTVVVIGGGNSAVGAARYLSRLCKRVTVVHRRDRLRAGKAEQEKLLQMENVEICYNSAVTAFLHEARVNGVALRDTVTGEEREISCDGVFVSVGQSPNTEIFQEQIELDAGGYVVADESTRTNLDGVFAAGDVRTKPLRQVVTARADGAVAASQAEIFLSVGV